jgi:hypothetical protein
MASCHTSATTVALDEVVERVPCDDGVGGIADGMR